jgi:RNA polymerase sigma factor (sigma-70 family)
VFFSKKVEEILGMKEIKEIKYPLDKFFRILPKAEEREMFQLYQETRDRKYLEPIIEGCIPKIKSIASKYAKKCVKINYYAFVSSGIIGLLKAIDRFDLNSESRLVSYAKHDIIKAMIEAIYESDPVPLSDNFRRKLKQIDDIFSEILTKLEIYGNQNNRRCYIFVENALDDFREIKSGSRNIQLKGLLDNIIKGIENSLKKSTYSIQLTIKEMEFFSDEVSILRKLTIPVKDDYDFYSGPDDDYLVERKAERKRINEILLEEIKRLDSRKKQIAILLDFYWVRIREVILKKTESRETKYLKELGVNLSNDLLKKERILRKDIANILGISNSMVTQIIEIQVLPKLRFRLETVHNIKTMPEEEYK